jgi:HK97 family phage major capsid protein
VTISRGGFYFSRAAWRSGSDDGAVAKEIAAMQLSDQSHAIVLPWVLRGQLWTAKMNHAAAVDKMIACGAPVRAVEIMKAPVSASSTQSPGYHTAVSAFVNTMQTQSVFFRLLTDNALVKVPLRTRVAFTASPPVGVVVPEGAAKPLAAAPFTTLTLEPVKAVSRPEVLTNEMLNDVGSAGQQHIARRLRAAVAGAADAAFLDAIVSTGTPSAPSSGTAATNAWKDLRAAQLLVASAGVGNYYWVCAPDVASKASTLADSAGAAAFPAMSAQGGELANLPCVVSSGVAPGELYLLDGSGIVGNSDTVETREASQASVQMSDTPNMSSAVPTPAQMVSLWQTNSTAFIAEVSLAARALRDDAVAIVTSINWGGP